jgi:hypothetical protein
MVKIENQYNLYKYNIAQLILLFAVICNRINIVVSLTCTSTSSGNYSFGFLVAACLHKSTRVRRNGGTTKIVLPGSKRKKHTKFAVCSRLACY